MIARPLTAMEVNRNVVIPPKTADGMAVRAAANLEKIPAMMRKRLDRWHENPSSETSSSDSVIAFTYLIYVPIVVTRFPVGTAGQSNHTAILSKGGHRRHGYQSGRHTVEAVRQDRTLLTRFKDLGLDLKAGDLEGRGGITDRIRRRR
jgi:hypothetical protein